MQIQTVGIPWYKPEHFVRLRAMFEDGHKLHPSYNEWLVAAEQTRKGLEAKGLKVVCVNIDPDEFPKWCHSEGMKIDADARNRYASWVAYQIISGAN